MTEDGFLEEVMSPLNPEGCGVSQVTGCCRGRGQETRSGAGAGSRGRGVANRSAGTGCRDKGLHWGVPEGF